MSFPAGLAPAAPRAGFPQQQAKVLGSGSAPPLAHPSPFAAHGAEASFDRKLFLWLVFLICHTCFIKPFLLLEQGEKGEKELK